MRAMFAGLAEGRHVRRLGGPNPLRMLRLGPLPSTEGSTWNVLGTFA